MTTCDRRFALVGRKWQGPHSAVSKQYVLATEIRGRKNSVCFAEQIVDLFGSDRHQIRIAVVTNVGCSDQVFSVPRDDEKRAAIIGCFYVNRILGGPEECPNNN